MDVITVDITPSPSKNFMLRNEVLYCVMHTDEARMYVHYTDFGLLDS